MRGIRHALGVRPVYKTVDTCAGEFPALTPYHYSSYDLETEVAPSRAHEGRHHRLRARTASARASSSTTRACTRRSRCSDAGYETVMVNCNPETVSTDYDTSDRLYFEPLTLEDVLEVLHAEAQSGEILGVICQLGGQTPLGLAKGIQDAGYRILGTSPDAIDLAEERELFSDILDAAGLLAPAPRHGDRRARARSRSPRTSATRCWCARASCSAAAAWRSSTTPPSLRELLRAAPPAR